MCDSPSRANGGFCGECCPLPATATGLYKYLIVLGVSTACNMLLNMIYFVGSLESLFFFTRAADMFSLVSFVCWWCVVAIICCKASKQEWLQPMKTIAMGVASIAIVLKIIQMIGSLIELSVWIGSNFFERGPADPAHLGASRQLRYLRFLRLIPLIEVVCLCVLFCKVRTAARLFIMQMKVGQPAV